MGSSSRSTSSRLDTYKDNRTRHTMVKVPEFEFVTERFVSRNSMEPARTMESHFTTFGPSLYLSVTRSYWSLFSEGFTRYSRCLGLVLSENFRTGESLSLWPVLPLAIDTYTHISTKQPSDPTTWIVPEAFQAWMRDSIVFSPWESKLCRKKEPGIPGLFCSYTHLRISTTPNFAQKPIPSSDPRWRNMTCEIRFMMLHRMAVGISDIIFSLIISTTSILDSPIVKGERYLKTLSKS